MKRIFAIALLMAGAALLSGCPKKHNVIEPPNAGSQVSGSTQGDNMGGDAAGPLARKVIYFDFDKSEIKPEFADVVAAHARNLTSHPNLRIKLEGNTDERGTSEYNLALGQKRAEAVRRSLSLMGVTDSQMEAVSLGKEKPLADGHDEASWAQNRRADLVYQQ